MLFFISFYLSLSLIPGNFLGLFFRECIPFQHQYHTKIDDQIDKTLAGMNQGLISKLMSVLEASLSKLSRYDEGSLIGSILSFTVSSNNNNNNKQSIKILDETFCHLNIFSSSSSFSSSFFILILNKNEIKKTKCQNY